MTRGDAQCFGDRRGDGRSDRSSGDVVVGRAACASGAENPHVPCAELQFGTRGDRAVVQDVGQLHGGDTGGLPTPVVDDADAAPNKTRDRVRG